MLPFLRTGLSNFVGTAGCVRERPLTLTALCWAKNMWSQRMGQPCNRPGTAFWHTHHRVMQVTMKGKNVDLISKTAVELYSLAQRCRKNNGKTDIWLELKPQGRMLINARYFLEMRDTKDMSEFETEGLCFASPPRSHQTGRGPPRQVPWAHHHLFLTAHVLLCLPWVCLESEQAGLPVSTM